MLKKAQQGGNCEKKTPREEGSQSPISLPNPGALGGSSGRFRDPTVLCAFLVSAKVRFYLDPWWPFWCVLTRLLVRLYIFIGFVCPKHVHDDETTTEEQVAVIAAFDDPPCHQAIIVKQSQ